VKRASALLWPERGSEAAPVCSGAKSLRFGLAISSTIRCVCHALLRRSLFSDSDGFGPVIDQRFLEPRMLQRLLRSDALLRVVNEDLSEQIVELFIEGRVRRDEILQALVMASAKWSGVLLHEATSLPSHISY
jgi:hypothetical protein